MKMITKEKKKRSEESSWKVQKKVPLKLKNGRCYAVAEFWKEWSIKIIIMTSQLVGDSSLVQMNDLTI